MTKLVMLWCSSGTVKEGLTGTLQVFDVGLEGQHQILGTPITLPANEDLETKFTEWQGEFHRTIAEPRKLKPVSISIGAGKSQGELTRELETSFKSWLRSDSFEDGITKLRDELSPGEEMLIVVRSEDYLMHQLPWHSWDLTQNNRSSEVVFGTSSFRTAASRKEYRNKKVRILAILGDSTDIDVAVDRKILEGLDAEVKFLCEPKKSEISDELWDQQWDILFFAGHGSTELEADATESRTGRLHINRDDSLTIDELKHGLRQAVAKGLHLAIFNSCDGLGLAQKLEELQIPQMIVMREPVPDKIAQEFLKYFLNTYSRGESLHLAVRQARQRLGESEGSFPCASWLPVIYQNISKNPFTWVRPKRKFSQVIQTVLLSSLLISSAVQLARWQGYLQPLELKAYDHLISQQPSVGHDDRIVTIRITPEDVRLLNQPPEETGQGARTLSDANLNRLFDKLDELNPRPGPFHSHGSQ